MLFPEFPPSEIMVGTYDRDFPRWKIITGAYDAVFSRVQFTAAKPSADKMYARASLKSEVRRQRHPRWYLS